MNYFSHLLYRLKSRGVPLNIVLDVGAHVGETNELIRSVYPQSRVISFEANPNSGAILKERGFECVICLLGKETTEETIPFYLNPKDPLSTGCSVYKERSEYFEHAQVLELPTYALDDIVPPEIVPDMLKMDVQGAELDILEGAKKILPRIKWIYLEVSFVPCNEGAPLFDTVYRYISDRGYRLVDMCDDTYIDNKLLQTNLLFERA
jgi:FkbM family methyltransferase